MRALLTAVVAMGVLIVAMVATLVVVIVRRLAVPPALAPALHAAPGTQIQAIASAGDRLAVLLQGGGADRIVLLDPRSGQVVGRIGLAP